MDEMSSQERVMTAFDHREPDRVPRQAPGLAPALHEAFKQRTGQGDVATWFRSDFRGVSFKPPGTLPDFSEYFADAEVPYHFALSSDYQAEWGVATVDAGYYHFGAPLHPMRNLKSLQDVEKYPFPDYVRGWGHDHFEAEIGEYHDRGFFVTGPVSRTFQTVWMLTGRDKLFSDAASNQEFVQALFDRVTSVNVAMATRCAEAGVDAISFSDDIGMQDRLMISPTWYRRWVKPGHARLIAAAKAVNPGIHVMFHSDGVITDVISDLVDVGVTVLTTVQPECMDPADIKRRFGARVSLGGTIGVQSTLPFGTPDSVRQVVKDQIETLGRGGGFFIGTANTCEPEVPWENVEAMYEAIEAYGTYRTSGT